jgi:hypothetical protein
LISAKPAGLIDALSFRIDKRPWKTKTGNSYEDWYVLEDFSAMGIMNEAAVSSTVFKSHESIARVASGGTGGIYKLIKGKLELRESHFSVWMQKPQGISYKSFSEIISRISERGRTKVWQRQMVLGPAPEFCLHSEDMLSIPLEYHPIMIRTNLIT